MFTTGFLLWTTLLFAAVYVCGSPLNGRCESDDHCGVIDSYCNNGTCVCKPHFVYHGDSCLQVVDPRMDCQANIDCRRTLRDRSICKDASCACLPYHHLHDSYCIKNRGLHERCDENYECYWGQDMINKMDCISGECTCKPGFRPHQHRRCELYDYSSADQISNSFVLPVVTLMIIAVINLL